MSTVRAVATLILTALVVVAGLLVASPAMACSCAEATNAQKLAAADAVFTGEVHEMQGVVSAADGAGCGLELAGLCGGTTTLGPALAAELDDLTGATSPTGTAGSPPAQGTAGLPGSGLSAAAAVIGGAALAVVAVGGFVLQRRRTWWAMQ